MKQIILHIDMNSYFASVEQQANPFLRGKPIGVTGKKHTRSVVAAASTEAKRLGVKTAMSTWEARGICPSLLLVEGDPKKYSDITARFLKIFHAYTPNVEQFSIDEAFLDVTGEAEDFLGAVIMAKSIKEDLRTECGEWITCSIGIAPNKLLAKMASRHQKPDGITVVKEKDIPAFLSLSRLEDVCGIGPRILRRLNALGIYTFAHLQKTSKTTLIQEFKQYGTWLWLVALGEDGEPVEAIDDPPKSMGHSYTVPRDLTSPRDMKRVLLALADRVAWRLRRDGYVAFGVAGHIRYNDFSHAGGSERFHHPIEEGGILARLCWNIIERHRHPDKPVRLIGVTAIMLQPKNAQSSLLSGDQKIQKLFCALDHLQRVFGPRSWTRASLIHTRFKERSSGFHYDHDL
ncbi:MAG: polymerase IV protein [Parcubacteria group bacterium GW2011_GWA2_56_7]|nr:MAG: polymerase IV protein [Parcubacteria group bacterium GW2011_GWA2_56_7]